MPLLPVVRTPEEHRRSPRDEATYRPAVEEILRAHGLPAEGVRKFADGSTIVFSAGGVVVKFFEPIFPGEADAEAAVLRAVSRRLGVPTPGVIATGAMEGWRYVVMERLAGVQLASVWETLDVEERAALCGEVGAAVARLHEVAADALPLVVPDWEPFLAAQREGAVERQRSTGLGEPWLSQVAPFLASIDLPARPTVLLHTEVMREHVMVARDGGGWRVSGIFDFEPAMRGDPEYELGSIGIFLCGGDAALFGATLRGYGWLGDVGTPAFRRRLMAYTLLHRYSRLSWYLDVVPPRRATTLEALADEWFSVS